MRIVTSFSPNRIPRQKHCLQSWLAAGCKVIAVQSPGETELLHQHFPQAQFIETELTGDVFGRPKLVRIKALSDLAATDPILIVNSDIEILMPARELVARFGQPQAKHMYVGVRWNTGSRGRIHRPFKWGIDIFQITPEISQLVPDIGMTMGCPVWDYWLIWYMHSKGFKIMTDVKKGFWHENHPANWSESEYRIGFDIVQREYGITEKYLTNFVQEVTHRKHIRR